MYETKIKKQYNARTQNGTKGTDLYRDSCQYFTGQIHLSKNQDTLG